MRIRSYVSVSIYVALMCIMGILAGRMNIMQVEGSARNDGLEAVEPRSTTA